MGVVYIYGLVDPRNDSVFYIGFTQYLKTRYKSHLNVYGKKREKNTYKNNVIRKIFSLGLKPEMKIIDECKYEFNNELNMFEHERLERYYIKKYKDDGIRLTNLTEGGDGGCTKLKPVYQYSESGEFLREYCSIIDFANNYGINAQSISAVLNQRRKKSYRGTYLFLSKEKANLFVFKETKKDNVPVVQYSLTGDFIKRYKSQKEASIETNIFQSNINHCLRKKRNSAGEFMWFYENNVPNEIKYKGRYLSKPINKYTLDGILLEKYVSINEAGRISKIPNYSISGNLRGKTKTAGGFVWKYKNNN